MGDAWDALNAESDSPHWEQFAEQQEAKDEGHGSKNVDDGKSPDAFVQVTQPSNDAWDALNAESDSPHWEQFAEQQEAKDEGKGSKNLDDGKSPDAFVQVSRDDADSIHHHHHHHGHHHKGKQTALANASMNSSAKVSVLRKMKKLETALATAAK